jgi:thiamine transport system substrate-binding protein
MTMRTNTTDAPRRARAWITLVLAVTVFATACADESAGQEIVLLTHDSFALSDGLLEEFTDETGIAVTLQTAGDAGSVVNQAILTKDNPIADVLYGIDTTFLSRAIDEGIFIPYRSPRLDAVPEALLASSDAVTPINYGDVCINYDIAVLTSLGLEPPRDLADLVTPAYEGLLAVQDPATSSPGLAFLLTTIDAFGDDGWQAYWRDLFANDVTVASDWTQAYNTEFTRSGGTRPLVVSYASSPPAEVLFGELDEAPTGVMEASCFRQVEFAGILDGTSSVAASEKLVDFLLSIPVQEDVPLSMFVYPANVEATLPDVFVEHTTFPSNPVTMDPDRIQQNRERWIEEWTAIARS